MTELQIWNKKYLEARKRYEKLKDDTDTAKRELDSTEKNLIEAMNDAGVIDFSNEDGVSFSRKDATKYSCLAENRPELLNQLEKDGLRDIFTVNDRTLNRIMAEMVEEHDGELPEAYKDIIKAFPQTKLSVRNRK